MNEITVKDPEVDISEYPSSPRYDEWGVKEATVYNTRISGDPDGRSATDIWKQKREDMSKEDLREDEEKFLGFLSERGHISAFYQSNVGLVYEVPRSTTLFLCSFDFPKYLQQSQRYTKARDFISYSRSQEVEEIFKKQSELYNNMIENEIPKEDARYILPLGTAAEHIHQNTNLAGLMNIHRVIKSESSLLPKITEDIFYKSVEKLEEKDPELFNEKIMDGLIEADKGYPVANMFSDENRWVNEVLDDYDLDKPVGEFRYTVDERLKQRAEDFQDEALTFLNLGDSLEEVKGYITSMSISAWHQFMRNDTVKNSIESVYDAAERGEMIVPPSIEKSNYEENYIDLFKESMELYRKRGGSENKGEAVELVPHGLDLGIAFSLDGFNLIKGFLPDRTQEAAQWEIRDIARHIEKGI